MKKAVCLLLLVSLLFTCGCAVSKGQLADPAFSKINYGENTTGEEKTNVPKATAVNTEDAVQTFIKGWGFIQNTVAAEEGKETKFTFIDLDGDKIPELIAGTESKNHYFKADTAAGQVLYLDTDAEKEYVPNWFSTSEPVKILQKNDTKQITFYVCDDKNGDKVAYTNFYVFVTLESGKFTLTPVFKTNHGIGEDGEDKVTDYFAYQDWGFELLSKEAYDNQAKRLERDYKDVDFTYSVFSSKDFDPENLASLSSAVKASFSAFKIG